MCVRFTHTTYYKRANICINAGLNFLVCMCLTHMSRTIFSASLFLPPPFICLDVYSCVCFYTSFSTPEVSKKVLITIDGHILVHLLFRIPTLEHFGLFYSAIWVSWHEGFWGSLLLGRFGNAGRVSCGCAVNRVLIWLMVKIGALREMLCRVLPKHKYVMSIDHILNMNQKFKIKPIWICV